MSLFDHPVARALLADAVPTPEAVRGCRDRLAAFLDPYLPRFRRAEQLANAALVLRGLPGGLQRKTCEPIAVEAGLDFPRDGGRRVRGLSGFLVLGR